MALSLVQAIKEIISSMVGRALLNNCRASLLGLAFVSAALAEDLVAEEIDKDEAVPERTEFTLLRAPLTAPKVSFTA
nr:hypothetical protein [uncultured Haemophilus sp.]